MGWPGCRWDEQIFWKEAWLGETDPWIVEILSYWHYASGHNHFFAKQELDGLVYKLVPQPGAMRYGITNSAGAYGYKEGNFLNCPGYLRIRVEGENATVELLQSSIDSQHTNKEVLFSYTVQAKKWSG